MNNASLGKALFLSLVCCSSLAYAVDGGVTPQATPVNADSQGKTLKAEEGKAPARKKRRKKSLAPSAMASPAVITVRGSAAFNAYMGNQKEKQVFTFQSGNVGEAFAASESRRASKHFGFNDSKIEFQIQKVIDPLKNLSWRFNVAFSADKSVATPKFVKQAYITLMSNYATIHLGNYVGPSDSMAVSGGSVLGDIGLDGFSNVTGFVPITTGVQTSFSLVGDTGEATKLTILSSRWKGFTLGFSYTPSTAQFGTGALNTASAPTWGGGAPVPYTVNNFEGGISYIGFLQPDLRLNLSITGVLGQARPERTDFNAGQSLYRNASRSIAFGGVLNYKNFAFGGEYAYCGRSMQLSADRLAVTPAPGNAAYPPLNYTARTATAPRWYNLGASYIYQKTKFAAGFMSSWRKTGFADIKAKGKIYNLSVTYQKLPGLDFYVEGFKINTKNDAALYEGKLIAQSLPTRVTTVPNITNQKANVVVLGMKVSF